MAITERKEHQRVVIKISGEALLGEKSQGVDTEVLERVAADIKVLVERKVQIGVVVGAGNFLRGATLDHSKISRVTGDQMGMVATIINAIAMHEIFSSLKIPTTIMSALPIDGVIEPYNHRNAIAYMEQGSVVIFAGGTGNPLVTTDTALCLRGIEVGADLLLKATNVDGVYSHDPRKNPEAKLYKQLSYDEALEKKLQVMDLTAFTLGRDHKMKLKVFNISKKSALVRATEGLSEGTLIE